MDHKKKSYSHLRQRVSLSTIEKRENKVKAPEFSALLFKGATLKQFYDSLPNVLKAKDLHTLLDRLVNAVQNKKLVSVGMGAHVVKTGISSLVIEAMKDGAIQHIAMNGAGPIHDFELAYQGETSEDVEKGLKDGTFGMSRETGEFICNSLEKYQSKGYGAAIGRSIYENKLPYMHLSILAQAYKYNVPVTVHAAIGTDIIYQNPILKGDLIGRLSMHDFDLFTDLLPKLHRGGVFMNFGSAVIIPEVFLKALTISRNVTGIPYDFTTANFDMLLHYRPQFNILHRPVNKGDGFHFTGHHEIMLPLLFALWKESL